MIDTSEFQLNQYVCFAYTTDKDTVDIADGIISDCSVNSIVVEYNNVFGPPTPTRILLENILERFE